MFRSFHLRPLLNRHQMDAIAETLEDCRETYNAALQERREAWRLQRKAISYYDQQTQLVELRKDPIFAKFSSKVQRDPLRRLDKAFAGFFRRCKSGGKPGFPRFKSKDRYRSFTFDEPVIRGNSLLVPKIGFIKFKPCGHIKGTVKTVTVKGYGAKWMFVVTCDIGPAPERCAVSNPIGIDVGLNYLVTLSDGTIIENHRWSTKHSVRVSAANRKLALKQRRSKNRIRAKEVLRRACQRIADARKNYLHHVSKWLVSNYDLIAYENLKIANMVSGHFAKSIHDAAWGELIWQITYKAESAGKWTVPVNPRGTSQICSGCGVKVPKTLAERTHSCACGLVLDRDHNAGLNILALGMSAAGASLQNVQLKFESINSEDDAG